MTGPFLRVQESKLYGPTWVNVARIVKIQKSSSGTTIFLEGVGAIQVEEAAEALIDRLETALDGRPASAQAGAPPLARAKRTRATLAEKQHG